MSVFQSILIRLGTDFCIYLTYILVTRQPSAPFGPPGIRRLIWCRGVIDAVELPLIDLSMRYLTQSEAMSCSCCSPLVTGIMCWVFVGERFNRVQIVACLCSISGVVLIANPFRSMLDDTPIEGGNPDHIPTDLKTKLFGLGLVIPVLFLGAFEIVLMRKIRTKASTAQILTIITFCPTLASACLLGVTRPPIVIPSTTQAWAVVLAIVPLGLAFQLSMTYALQRTSGLKVDSVQYSSIVISTLLQWAMYGNHPRPLAYVGMVIITLAGLCGLVYGPSESAVTGENVGHDEERTPLLRDEVESEVET